MFQANKMNEIDNFFMRNNNQVTPKRSHSPRLLPQMQQNQRMGAPMQFFPSNKENLLPNRVSMSPSKAQYPRKPMISGPGSRGGNISPSLLVSPRSQNPNQCFPLSSNNGYQNMRGFQQELNKPQFSGKPPGSSQMGLIKRMNPQSSDIKFVMSKGVDYCQNHGNKVAEFSINIEGDKMKYCSVCASKLASQGFIVVKIVNESQKSVGASLKRPKPIQAYAQYRGNPFYEEISAFLRDLVRMQGRHYEAIHRFTNLEPHYNTQIQLTTSYYDEVIRILTQMKEEHLQDLCEEKEKYIQLAHIQVDYLNQNLEEILHMREDIESNIPSIVNEIEEESFNKCVDEYRQKLNLYTHSVEEKEDNLKMVTSYDEEQLRKKVEDFEAAMKDLWREETNQQQKPSNKMNNQMKQPNNYYESSQEPVSVKNMHDMLPKSSVEQVQGQGACRPLFVGDEDDDDTLPIPSPQFKKI